MHEIWIFLDQMTSLDVINFLHKVPLAPSKCLSKWIKVDKWDYFQNGSQDFFFSFLFSLLIFIYFFKYETIVRSSAWSFDHSDPDPSSVNYEEESAFSCDIFYLLRLLLSCLSSLCSRRPWKKSKPQRRIYGP